MPESAFHHVKSVRSKNQLFGSTGLENSASISFNVRPARCVQLTAIESNKSDKSRTDNDETEDDRAYDDEWVFHTEANYA